MPRLTSLVDNPTLQQQQTVPRLSFADPAPVAPAVAPTADRALPVWMVEDRRTYWDTIRKIQAEYDEQQRQRRMEEFQRQNELLQFDLEEARRRRPLAPSEPLTRQPGAPNVLTGPTFGEAAGVSTTLQQRQAAEAERALRIADPGAPHGEPPFPGYERGAEIAGNVSQRVGLPEVVGETAFRTIVPATPAELAAAAGSGGLVGETALLRPAVRRVTRVAAPRANPIKLALAEEAGALKLPTAAPRKQFSPAVETLLQRGADSGVDRQLFDYATQRAADVPNPNAWPLKSYFNRVRALWDSAVIRNPTIQTAYLAGTRYADAQFFRIQSITQGMNTAVRQAFTNANGVDNALRAAYNGPTTPALQPFIGTPWHFLDNPNLYPNATPMQKQLAKSWDDITRNELRFSESVGIPVSEWEDAWIKHTFKNPERVTTQVGGRKGAGLTKKRKLSTEEFVALGQKVGAQVDTDVVAILNRRLAASARVRANIVYMDAVSQALGGKQVKAFPVKGPKGNVATFAMRKTPQGMTRIELGGKAWDIPSESAESVMDTLRPMKGRPDEKAVETVLDATRATLLNLDFSAGGGRQFMLGFMADPIGAPREWGRAMLTYMTPEGWAEWYAKNAQKAEFLSQRGLQLRMSPLDIESQLKGVRGNPLDNVPGVKQLNAIQFESILPMVKINTAERAFEMLKAQQKGGLGSFFRGLPIFDKLNSKLTKPLSRYSDDELWNVVNDVTNNWLGGIEWARIGQTPGVVRKFLLLTEGWTRAQMGVILNAPKLSPKGVLARRMLAQELAMGAGLSTALSLMLVGELPEYDPRKTGFLNVKTPIGNVPTMPHATIIRSVVQGLAGKHPDDLYGDESFVGQRLDALGKFAEGRIGQVARLGYELQQGEDYYGRPISSYDDVPLVPSRAEFVGRELLPIIAQGVWQDVNDGRTPQEMTIRSSLEFGGFNLRPFTPTQKVDQLVAEEKIAKTGGGVYERYHDLPPDLKGEFDKRHVAAVEQLKEYRASRGRTTFDQIKADTLKGLAELAPLAATDPAVYREQAGDLVGDQALITQRELQGLDLPEREGDLAILDGYFKAVESATNEATHVTDFDKRDVLDAQYRASLSAESQQRLDEMLVYSADPTYQRLKVAKQELDAGGYFDRRDTAFTFWRDFILKGEIPADVKVAAQGWQNSDDLAQWAKQRLIDRGFAPESYTRDPVWNAWEKTYDKKNQEFLVTNPVLDALAVEWGYQTRVHSPEAARIYEQRTGLRAPIPAN